MSPRSLFVALAAALAAAVSTAASAAPPAAPSPCGSSVINTPTMKGVQVIWSNVAGEDGYTVYRDGVAVASTAADVTWLFDNTFPVRGNAVYCVQAYNADGVSGQCCSQPSSTLLTTAIVDGPDWYQDCFPTSEVAVPGTPPFDLAPAKIGSGRNTAPLTGNTLRFVIPRGWAAVTPTAAVARVDLVFRVRPGVGNYAVVGAPAAGLTVIPGGPLIAMGDGSFWSTYIALNGPFGTGSPGTNGTPHHAADVPLPAWPVRWDPNTWNSARCAAVGGQFVTNQFAFPALKIIPDALLTAGASVEYFFRITTTTGSVILLPDTNRVLQADGQRSIDGHRWERFSVLPDRWKDPAFGGMGMPAMLVVDLDDGGGNERIWDGIADSTGATAPAKYGAHGGWHAIGGGADIDDPSQNRLNDNTTAGFISHHAGQPGTTWDLYNVRGGSDALFGNAGSLGCRLAAVPIPPDPLAGQESKLGPTPLMLRTYYRMLMLLTGSRHTGILGPFNDRGQNEVTLLDDFLTNPGGGPQPRGLYINGDGFVESELGTPAPTTAMHQAFVFNRLGLNLRHSDYRVLANTYFSSAELSTWPPHTAMTFDLQLNSDVDVLQPNAIIPEVQAAAYLENLGFDGPYVASVYKPSTPARPWVALTDGWNLDRLGTGKGFVCYGCLRGRPEGEPSSAERTQTANSRLAYFYDTMQEVFGSVAPIVGSPSSTTDVPRNAHPEVFFRLLNNPVTSGEATLRFTVPDADRVEVTIYDPMGRRVRKLVERDYPAGTWDATWDGRDDAGRALGRGVYFARVRLAMGGAEAARKLVMVR